MLSGVLGALRAGIIPVLLNPTLLPHETAAMLSNAEPALVLGEHDMSRWVAEGPETELSPVPLVRPMHYTSGTTGVPKGVYSGLLADDDAAALVSEERELWGFDAHDVHLVCSPLHHSAPLRFAVGSLLAGGDVIVTPRFEANTVAATLAREAPTSMFCVPAHLQRLLSLETKPRLDSLRLVAHAGAPCPPNLKREALAAFPRGAVWEFYGSTEGQFTACSPEEWQERPGTVGRARPGRSLWVDGAGGIWCAVPRYARFEYWRAPEKTRAAWRGDAFTVGDLGRLDRDGYLFLDGRRDDLVITGGVNVYPIEVEQVIMQLAGVTAAAAFGVDDERWGQRLCAAVVGDVTAADVVAHCRSRLAGYKRPKSVVVVDDLPTTATGKLRRSTLAADLGLVPTPQPQ